MNLARIKASERKNFRERLPFLGTSMNKGKEEEPGQGSSGPHGALEVAKLARLEPVQHKLEGPVANSGTPRERVVHGGAEIFVLLGLPGRGPMCHDAKRSQMGRPRIYQMWVEVRPAA
jgi:hypothetical protein